MLQLHVEKINFFLPVHFLLEFNIINLSLMLTPKVNFIFGLPIIYKTKDACLFYK